jgi:hypothetical protein
MNELDPQAFSVGDGMDAVLSAKERGMGCLWQAVAEQIADPEAMRLHVNMAQTLLGTGKTYTWRR